MRILACLLLAALAPACVTHTHVDDFNGVDGIRGEPVEYQFTSSYALHLAFIFGILGDAGKPTSIESFTAEASARGAQRVRITNVSTTTYWYIFPPLSFLIHPVVTTVQGDVEGSSAELAVE